MQVVSKKRNAPLGEYLVQGHPLCVIGDKNRWIPDDWNGQQSLRNRIPIRLHHNCNVQFAALQQLRHLL